MDIQVLVPLRRALRRTCTMEGVFTNVEHICAGDVRRVPTYTALGGFKVSLPYCEFHARWVRGEA